MRICGRAMRADYSPLACLLFLSMIMLGGFLNSQAEICELSIIDRNKLYNYSLASPSPNFPHGALSEDGFYKVAANGTVLWFQLCDRMIFNHNPPKCVDCWGCGGSSRCGMNCSALLSTNIGGYHVCSTIGHVSSTDVYLIDKKKPHTGVIVKMSSSSTELICSLSVSIICDLNGVQGPELLKKTNDCDYSTELRHPSGCAEIVSIHGKGWGWFSTLLIMILCLFGGYLLTGAVYRFFGLGIRGIEVIPNLGFWASLPHRTKSLIASLVQRFGGPSEGHRSSYSAVNF